MHAKGARRRRVVVAVGIWRLRPIITRTYIYKSEGGAENPDTVILRISVRGGKTVLGRLTGWNARAVCSSMPHFRGVRRLLGRAVALGLPLLCIANPTLAQDVRTVTGRVTDQSTGRAVEGAGVRLMGTDFGALTDETGLFQFGDVAPGTFVLRITHLAYGEHDTEVVISDSDLALRVELSPEAIELERIIVTGETEEQRVQRTGGTSSHVISRDQIVALMPTSRHIGDVLSQGVPGIRTREAGQAGANTCIEFRTVGTPRFATRCLTPVLIVDGVRVYDPPSFYNALQLEQLQRIEVVPPSAAGMRYGMEAAFGVIVVNTQMWADAAGINELPPIPPELQTPRTYDWSLEAGEHSTAKVFALAFVGNALGLAAGLAIAENCIDFSEVAYDFFSTSCGTWGTAGSRLAALTLPILGAATATRYGGGTPVSHGKFGQTLVAGLVMLVPGYALSSSGEIEQFGATRWAGRVFVGLGVPLAAAVADRLLRTVRSGG